MQDSAWKKVLSELSLDELKEAQRFINELIPMLQAVEEPAKVAVEERTEALAENDAAGKLEIFPPFNSGERREDTRFDMEIKGIYSIIKIAGSEFDLPVETIQIKDISKHGIRFVTNQFLPPSSILLVKFNLPASDTRQLYKNSQKNIYAEVRRVVAVSATLGFQYHIGAKSIDHTEALELLKENEGFAITSKRLATKEDIRVLFVSTNETLSKHLQKMLQHNGYIVNWTNKTPQAIALLRKTHHHIVITDMVIVGIHDYEFIKHLKDEFPDTGLAVEVDTLEDWLKVMPLGVDDYLTKNFSDKEFMITIELLHKKVLQKSLLGNNFAKKYKRRQNILVIGTDGTFKKFLCDVSKKTGFTLYFVTNTKHAMAVLRKYKMEVLFIDASVADPSECVFITKVKKDFPSIEVMVISSNYQERHQFLASGADRFFIAQIGMQDIASALV